MFAELIFSIRANSWKRILSFACTSRGDILFSGDADFPRFFRFVKHTLQVMKAVITSANLHEKIAAYFGSVLIDFSTASAQPAVPCNFLFLK